MPLHPDVERISSKVRARVVRWVANNQDVGNDLCGACAIASYTLWRALRAIGRQARLVAVEGGFSAHCWVELSGYVVDITATQFGGPKIAIFRVGDVPDWADDAYEHGQRLVNDAAVEDIEGWNGQSPVLYRTKIDRLVDHLAEEFSGTPKTTKSSAKSRRRSATC